MITNKKQNLNFGKKKKLLRQTQTKVAALTIVHFFFFAMSYAAVPNPQNPPYTTDFITWNGCNTHDNGFETLFWEVCNPNPGSCASANDKIIASGMMPYLDVVDWGKEGCEGSGCQSNQYRTWLAGRQHYLAQDRNGNIFKPMGCGQVILPSMPIDQKDWPSGMTNATYGDWVADRIGRFCVLSHLVSVATADFWDGVPHSNTAEIGFNQEHINSFAKVIGKQIPGTTNLERARHIVDNYMVEWNDFIAEGYVNQFAKIAAMIKKELGYNALIRFQGTHSAPHNRYLGRDLRIYEKKIVFENGCQALRYVECQGDALRTLMPLGFGYFHLASFACQVPDMWIGGQMSAGSSEYDISASNTFKNTGLLAEFKEKYLKAHWLSIAWTHIANRDGTVRRAPVTFMRQYWDGGKVPADAELLFKKIYPTRCFGPAFYYSKSIEQWFERNTPGWNTVWKCNDVFMNASNKGLPAGYFVSDVAIDGLKKNMTYAPTAFVTVDLDKMDKEERKEVESIASIYDLKTTSVDKIPSPIRFSSDVCGYAFIDQENRTIIVTWRPMGYGDASQSGNTDIQATVSFEGCDDGVYTVTDVFNIKNTYNLTISGGKGSFSYPHARWACCVHATNVPSPVKVTQAKFGRQINQNIDIQNRGTYRSAVKIFDTAGRSVNTFGSFINSLDAQTDIIRAKNLAPIPSVYIIKTANSRRAFQTSIKIIVEQ